MKKVTILTVIMLLMVTGLSEAGTIGYLSESASPFSPNILGSRGGEFRIYGADTDYAPVSALVTNAYGNVAIDFVSFCIEETELVGASGSYYYDVGPNAINGGLGGGSPDPVSNQTAWLFSQFWNGTLSDYDFTNTGTGRSADAGQLQAAFWFLEDELTAGQITTMASLTKANSWIADANIAVTNGYRNGDGGLRVQALNLYTNSAGTNRAQDMLVATTAVPTPSAWGAGLLLLGSLGIMRQRNRRRGVV